MITDIKSSLQVIVINSLEELKLILEKHPGLLFPLESYLSIADRDYKATINQVVRLGYFLDSSFTSKLCIVVTYGILDDYLGLVSV